MEIIEKNIFELREYKNNPRNNDAAVSAVANSIEKFGFKNPIIVDKNGVIVAGHTRFKAAKKLGLKNIPCILADDLTDEQIKAFRLADNKTAEIAEWNPEKLELELKELQMFPMNDFGFENMDFGKESFHPLEEKEESEETDEIPEADLDIEKLDKYYGIPYLGNKSRIADAIINLLPEGKRFVDLFGGGGAITHCAFLSGKWESFLYNDINPLIVHFFMDAIDGKYLKENRIFTREQFKKELDSNPIAKICWSFNQDGKTYIFGKDSEKENLQAIEILYEENIENRKLQMKKLFRQISKMDLKSVHKLENFMIPYNRMKLINSLYSLKEKGILEKLEATIQSYENFKPKEGDVIYCDIPYQMGDKEECNQYRGAGVFDNLKFYEWCKNQKEQIYFSSYEISDTSFYKVKIKDIFSFSRTTRTEYIYSNKPIIPDQKN